MVETELDNAHTTPARSRPESDIALLFPPLRDIRIVLNLTLPIAVFTGLTVWSIMANARVTTFLLASMTAAMVLISWFFFLRAAFAETKQPTQLPDYRAGWSVPFRFQPEIRWQTISLAMNAAGLFIAMSLAFAALFTLANGVDSAIESLAAIGRVYVIGFLIGIPMIIPLGALQRSRYGVDKNARRARDGGLPIFLIRRREAAIEALRKKWPDAVPMEANFQVITVSGPVDDDRIHAIKAILASILTKTIAILLAIAVFAFVIWYAEHPLAWDGMTHSS